MCFAVQEIYILHNFAYFNHEQYFECLTKKEGVVKPATIVILFLLLYFLYFFGNDKIFKCILCGRSIRGCSFE